MTARTAKALADVLEPHLAKTGGRTSLRCDSEDEAVLLAHEMKKRGWRASAGTAFADLMGDMRIVNVVKVTGRKKGAVR